AVAAFSLFLIARGIGATDPVRALGHFAEAASIWEGLPGGAPYLAQVDMHVAALALQSGEAAVAARLTARAIPRARAAQNAALLANLLMIEAAALAAQGEAQGARARWLDSLGWARYGFGAERLVRDRAESIARLAQGQEQG
ncbi:MAG: ATP-dependent transcriptional regulator, partial [Gemmobacter sp.]